MRRSAVTVALLAALLAGAAGGIEPRTWLPPEVEAGATQQLADRMRMIGAGGEDDAERLSAAAGAIVGSMADRIDEWGLDGLMERAPVLDDVDLPATDDRHLDAMARYQLCNLVLLLELQDAATAADPDTRLEAVLGLTGITLAVVRLREPFVAETGDDAGIEAHLTDPSLESVVQAVQGDAGLRDRIATECEPALDDLLAEPRAMVGAPDAP